MVNLIFDALYSIDIKIHLNSNATGTGIKKLLKNFSDA